MTEIQHFHQDVHQHFHQDISINIFIIFVPHSLLHFFLLKLQTHPIELHFKETAISGASCACGGKVDWPAMHTSWKHFAPLRQLAPKVVEVDGSRLTKRAESAHQLDQTANEIGSHSEDNLDQGCIPGLCVLTW